MADGNITVIGHESQGMHSSHTHTEDQVHLGDASNKGDSMVLHCQVDQHVGWWCDEAGIQEGTGGQGRGTWGLLSLGSVQVMKMMRPFMAIGYGG